ncbi:hypothetical protein ACSBR2_014946 [Camellia fascicularis]
MMDEPESSRQKEVNSKIDNQVAPDSKDDVVDGKEEGLASQTYDSLRMLTKVDVLQMKFNSKEDAYSFYNAYAKVIGFSVQRSKKRICGDNKFVESTKWVCSREGVREKKYLQHVERVRTPRAETRLFCSATFRVHYDKTIKKYVVTYFVGEHNHPLAAPYCVPFLWSHRFVTSADQAQAKAIRNVGMRTSQIMDFMVHQSGGYEKVGFIHRDLHNQFQVERKVQLTEGDTEGALGYLSAKLDADPLFFFKYNVDKDNRLDKIFWANGRSRMDYAAFGDVLVFDTTYRANQYKKPFVILAGMSNHFMTIIFGCALLPDETIETHTWVLETLMEAMDGQRPISVVTDGDRAMHQAIERVIPNFRHRLCSRLLEKNASTNARMVKQYKLENNNWVLEIHRKRDKWAEAYLRGHMFAGMRSTQCFEGMNAYFNMFLEQKVRLYEFVAQYDRALARMCVNETETESKTENSFPVLTTPLRSLEKHATELFTRKIFSLFRREISKEGKLFVMERVELEDRRTYRFGEYKVPTSTWTVEYFPADITIKCCCLKFESFGIPCCHMVAVMKSEQLMCIPPSCVLKRWTRRVKTKGNPRGTSSMGKPPKPRQCGYCRSIGHTKRKCKKLASTSRREGNDLDIETFMNTELEPHMEDIDEPTNSQV